MKPLLSAGCLLPPLLFFACNKVDPPAPTFPEKAPDTLRILSYHLNDWRLEDRDGDLQADDPKPLPEQEHILHQLKESHADVLLLRGLGTNQDAQDIAKALSYPHVQCHSHIATISHYPIKPIQKGSVLTYKIKGTTYSLAGHFQHLIIQPNAQKPLHILHISFKDKTYHQAGQNEMRRNEARLLKQYLANWAKTTPTPPFILVGTLHNAPNATTLRKIREALPDTLIDARPTDPSGTSWTFYQKTTDHYERSDYLLHPKNKTLSTSLPEANIIGSHSPYRPLIIDLAGTPKYPEK